MIAEQFIGTGYPISRVLGTVGLSRSSYYYKPVVVSGKKGCPKSKYTYTRDGIEVSNKQVVLDIKYILGQEFVDYGYLKVTHWLRQEKGYIINPKKVYRLMSEKGLLNKARRAKKGPRNWVKELLPPTKQCFDYLEFDIKYMYVAGKNRNALALSVIDVNSRWVLGQYINWQVRKKDVKELFDQIFSLYQLPAHIHVRCDNGSQFVAREVQKYFADKPVTQEFCKPATPEQNAHVESYHSIMESVVCQRYEFNGLEELHQTMGRFVRFYDYERIHSGVGYTAPIKFLRSKGIDIYEQDIKCALDPSSTKVEQDAQEKGTRVVQIP